MSRAALLALLLSRVVLAASPGPEALPFFFVPNRGQASADVRYMTRGSGLTVQLRQSEIELRVAGRAVTLRFEGANPASLLESGQPLPGRANFFYGSPWEWRTDIPLFNSVLYRGLYPGIDLRYAGAGRNLKSEFLVAPGADPASIRLRYAGAEVPRLDPDGSLVVPVDGMELREHLPLVYQEGAAGREIVEGRFALSDNGAVGFVVGRYDRARALVIDPVLAYSTLFGGSGSESALGLAVDSTGAAYIAGFTDSLNLPATNAAQSFSGGGNDVFVAKLSPGGSSLVYCTYLGGTADDRASAVAVDSLGSVYLTGSTSSKNFPVYAALQAKIAGYRNAFVTKLNPAGNALVYSTYLGGNASDTANSIAIDAVGAAYIAGDTTSFSFPATGYQRGTHGGQDVFAAKLSADGSRLIYSTYLGGSSEEHGAAIAVDSSGSAWIAGATTSTDFPVLNAAQRNNAGGQDAFVTRLSADGNSLLFSTYLGGSGGTVMYPEMAQAIALDLNGYGYAGGVTSSPDFPLVAALQTSRRGQLDAFVVKISPGGSLVYSTYLGGSSVDVANAIAVDAGGAAYVAGYSISTDLPVANPLQGTNGGDYDAFLARLSPGGDVVQFLSYLGGNGSDSATAVALDSAANAYLAGYTLSTNFPLLHPFQANNGGNYGAFVTKIDFTGLRTSAVLSLGATRNGTFVQGGSAGYSITVSNQAVAPATTGTVTVRDTLPPGLTLTSMAGQGWACVSNACTRSDPLPGGSSYPPVTVAVNISLTAGSPQNNSITVSGGGAASALVNDATPITILPLWGISSSHSGSWLQGQSTAYSVNVWNLAGAGPTVGLVTVTDTLPAGLVLNSMSGTGWTCGSNSCTRADSLAGGASYPVISVNVAIPLNASSPQVNGVAVSGGTGAPQSATDSTVITYLPVLSIASTHTGSITQGQSGAYTLTVANQAGSGPTTSAVTVAESLPVGLSLASMSGTGWNCTGATCTRSDVLAPGASYPPITASVNAAPNAASPQVNSVSVSGGGAAPAGATDTTAINPMPVLSVAIAHIGTFTQGQSGSYGVTVSNQAGVGATNGMVSVLQSPPAGLTLAGMSGTGWTCGASSCTRSDALAGGASFPPITVTVNVGVSAPTPQVHSVTVTGGSAAGVTGTHSTPIVIPPLLRINSTHNGNFTAGQSGVFMISVWNLAGAGPTTASVTVTESLPASLTLVSMTGTGWNCGANACMRSDPLPAGGTYPSITATVAVAAGATSPQVNLVTVSGGGAVDSSATDSATITLLPGLSIGASHTGPFAQGQNGTYTATVTNQAGAGPVTGTVTVTEALPAGLTLVSMAGSGWTCAAGACTRGDGLAAGASYPSITIVVAVAINAPSPQVNSLSVSGGGSPTSYATDSTVIIALPVLAITLAHTGSFTQGQGGAYTVTVSNQAGAGPTNGSVTVAENLPSGLTLSSMTGSGWTCVNATCTRSDALAAGASYPAIGVTVNVAANAASPQVNSVSVSGGGSAPATATDSTTLSCSFQLTGGSTFSPLAGTGSAAISTTGSCSWTASSGASWLHITSAASGSGSATLSFSVDANAWAAQRTATLTAGSASLTVYQGGNVIQAGPGLRFVPSTPCRIADTRIGTGPYGGPAVGPSPRDFSVIASACGIPATAQAYSLNLTVVPSGTLDALYVWPAGQAQPGVPNLSSTDGRVKADMAIVAAGTNGSLSIAASQTTHVIVDINGYFVPASGASDLAFYPVTPCRLVDTRIGTGALAGPAIAASQYRTFPLLSSPCNIPAAARAYALNVTVIPSSAFGFLSIWPAGNPQPVVSTLNAPTGAVTANAAIVPAGDNGAITVIASNNAALILDINGYFAPPGAGGLQFYPQTPCRITDTRLAAGAFGGPQMGASSQRDFLVTASACGVPLSATAYSLNASVVPPAPLGFLSLWGAGGQPTVSTLNAADGATIMNTALVPAGVGGTISAFTSNATHLLLDISGYFAP